MNSDLPEGCLYPKDAFLILNTNRPNQIQPFVIDLHLQYRLKKKQNVLLILLLNDWEHTNSIAAKLGINLSIYKQNGLLDYVDMFDLMKDDTRTCVDWKQMTEIVLQKVDRLPENSYIMIDDLSLFYVIHSQPNQVYNFVHEILKRLKNKNCSALVGSASECGDERMDSHVQFLKYQCDVWIDCGGASSGFSKNFDGIIKCMDMKTNSTICANYKLQLRSVVFSNI